MENLPENLLLDIMVHVPASDLISNCRLVCSQWRDLVDQPVLWKRKYQEKDTDSSPEPLNFYIFGRLKKNLIKNPDGQDGLDSWEVHTSDEGHWETEELSVEESKNIPLVSRPCEKGSFEKRDGEDEDPPVPLYKCFAARNGPCSKSQLITLKDKGYWDELMDEARPTIMVTDCFSCELGSYYILTVKLLSADFEVLKEEDYKEEEEEEEECKEGCPPLMNPVLMCLYKYPPGVRHILFEHKFQKIVCSSTPPIPSQPQGGMRVLQSSITLHPPSTEEEDDDYYDHSYSDSYSSESESIPYSEDDSESSGN